MFLALKILNQINFPLTSKLKIVNFLAKLKIKDCSTLLSMIL